MVEPTPAPPRSQVAEPAVKSGQLPSSVLHGEMERNHSLLIDLPRLRRRNQDCQRRTDVRSGPPGSIRARLDNCTTGFRRWRRPYMHARAHDPRCNSVCWPGRQPTDARPTSSTGTPPGTGRRIHLRLQSIFTPTLFTDRIA